MNDHGALFVTSQGDVRRLVTHDLRRVANTLTVLTRISNVISQAQMSLVPKLAVATILFHNEALSVENDLVQVAERETQNGLGLLYVTRGCQPVAALFDFGPVKTPVLAQLFQSEAQSRTRACRVRLRQSAS